MSKDSAPVKIAVRRAKTKKTQAAAAPASVSSAEGLIVGAKPAKKPAAKKTTASKPGSAKTKKEPIVEQLPEKLTWKERIQKFRDKKPMWILPAIFYVVAFAYELILKSFLGGWSVRSVMMLAVFSLVWAFVGFLLSFLPRIAARILSSIAIPALAAVFIIQFSLIQIRSLPASLAQMGMVKSEVGPVIATFWKELHNNWPLLAAFILVAALGVFAVWFFNFSRPKVKNWWQTVAFTLGVTVAGTGVVLLTLQAFGEKFASPMYLYFESSDMRAQVRELGLIATETIDIRQVLLGFEPTVSAVADPTKKAPKAPEYTPQIVFDLEAESKSQPKKLAQISSALAGTSPSYTNKYTGAFADKNLVFIVAESFNSIGIDQTLTPNLYKMSNEGFVFDNFYSPYILSTIGGEFQTLTGLMPTQSLLKTWREGKTTFPLAIGHSFAREGYDSASSYSLTENTYYDRNKTRPTLGFSDYLACGQGMDKLLKPAGQCERWVQSDVQLVDTIAPYITEKAQAKDEDGNRIPFTSYLLTMSGHGEYDNWGFHWVANKHKAAVNSLKMSTEAKIYQASQIELDEAVGNLVESLRAVGELDNTVIVLVGDHYPYMMSLDAVNELSDYERDATIDVNHSAMIMWNSAMADGRLTVSADPDTGAVRKLTTTRISKVGSSVDVLPTLLNLWGIKFDSRLLIGRDILDDASSGLAVFADRSWVSDYGRYYAGKKLFVRETKVEDGAEASALPGNYAQLMNQFVASRFNLSEGIVQNNYYSSLEFGK